MRITAICDEGEVYPTSSPPPKNEIVRRRESPPVINFELLTKTTMQTKPIAKNQTNFLQVIGEHKCCVHCKSNVHAPHTSGCPSPAATSYLDARTPEERANEPESITTVSSPATKGEKCHLSCGERCYFLDNPDTQYTASPADTERWEEEFDGLLPEDVGNGNLYGAGSVDEWLQQNTEKHLYCDTVYPESMCEIDADKVKSFIRRVVKSTEERGFKEAGLSCKLDHDNAVSQRENEILREIKNKITVYYRSKFSQDCSRNETDEEKNTEMIALSDLTAIINKVIV